MKFHSAAPAGMGLAVGSLFMLAFTGCETTSAEQAMDQTRATSGQVVKQWELDENDTDWDGKIEIRIAQDLNSFVAGDTLERIVEDMGHYFQASNDGEWAAAMHHHPLHKQTDTAFLANAVELMTRYSEMGLRNRTEAIEVLYASKAVDDGDQEVVLINMDLTHFVDFNSNFEGNVEGMKGMVESNYGKGNATYHEGQPSEIDSLPPYRYWEVRGQSRIWALSHKDSAHWCFLPANFNEGGGANYMTGTAMVEALRHRRSFDPNYEQKR